MQVLVALLAGLGLIFVGTHFLTTNMKQAAGPGFRRLVKRAAETKLKGGLLGIGAGAVIQSTNAVTFIVVGLVSAGAITVRQGMPIVSWCYSGTTLRLLLVSIDIKTLTLALVAAIGAAYALGYNKSVRHGYLVGAGLGMALLMLGVEVLADAAAPLRDSPTMAAVVGLASEFYLLGFIAGAALAAVIQGMTVSIIAIALAQAGVLDADATILIVVGANVGSGVMSMMQGSALKGTERQLSLYQIILKGIGAAALLPLLLLEHYAGLPTVKALVSAVSADVAFQVTLVHWLFQIVAAAIATPLDGRLQRFVERLSPPSEEEALSRPQFLTPEATARPDEAARAAQQEQLRLLARLPDFLAAARGEEHGRKAASLPVLKRASKALAGEIDAFLRDAVRTASRDASPDRLLRLWNGVESLAALQEALAAFADALPRRGRDAEADRIVGNLTEGMHALLETVILEIESGEVDADLIDRLTRDRADFMRRLQDRIAAHDPPLPSDVRLALLAATDRFERVTWLLRRYAWNVGALAPQAADAEPAPA